MEHLILNFTDTYPETAEDSLRKLISDTGSVTRIHFNHLSGTDMYCDADARSAILAELSAHPVSGVHLLDSGNYHYMTRLFTSLVAEDYILVFYDHHTDMKPAAFDLLSCGAWAKEMLEEDSHLRQLILVGPPENSVAEIEDALRSDPRLVCISEAAFLSDPDGVRDALLPDLPLYLSVDKDILREEDVLTNWDQGQVPLSFLLTHLEKLLRGKQLLGADICGLLPASDRRCTDFEAVSSFKCDKQLFVLLAKHVGRHV